MTTCILEILFSFNGDFSCHLISFVLQTLPHFGFIQGFRTGFHSCPPGSECVVTPRAAYFLWTPPWSPWHFLKAPVAWQTEHQPPTLEDLFAPTYPGVTKLRTLNLWTFPAGAFQPNWCHLIVFVCLPRVSFLSPLLSVMMFGMIFWLFLLASQSALIWLQCSHLWDADCTGCKDPTQ